MLSNLVSLISLLILLCCLNVSYPSPVNTKYNCSEGWFQCKDGMCISHHFLCDDKQDCNHGDDEVNCNYDRKTEECSHLHYRCLNSSTCIPNRWLCNNKDDCPQKDDEFDCPEKNITCLGFQCKNFKCIEHFLKCDGLDHCGDNSDEESCKNVSQCGSKMFECSNGECIPLSSVCDNHTDCLKGEDEGSGCYNNNCSKLTCSHSCINLPQGAKCSCPEGYQLSNDGINCEDINECEQHICSHFCHNLVGGFSCSCSEGYILQNDNRTCLVKGTPLILFSISSNIRAFYLRNTSQQYIDIHQANCVVKGKDMLISNEKIVWGEVCRNHGKIVMTSLNHDEPEDVIANGLVNPEDVSVDWVAHNLYIADSGLKQIIACSIEKDICAVIVRDSIGIIKSIILDPENAKMYWTDWGKRPGIYQASMDGSGISIFIENEIGFPSGITIDHTTERMYWGDWKLCRIEYYEFSTQKRKLLFMDVMLHPISLTVFEDTIYWSDENQKSIYACNKFNGHNHRRILKFDNETPIGIHVYHPVLERTSTNPCWGSGCSHLCLLSQKSYKCLCPSHLQLDSDGNTCKSKANDTFLLVSNVDSIHRIYFESVGRDIVMKLNSPKIEIGSFAYELKTNTLFLNDLRQSKIVAIDPTTGHYSNSLSPLDNSRVRAVRALTYDYYTNNLYWLDPDEGFLHVATRDGEATSVLLKNLERPVGLALYQERNEIYISILGTDPQIMVCNMDGSNLKRLIQTEIGLPSSVFICKKSNRLYWSDIKLGTINALHLNEQDELNSQYKVLLYDLGQIVSLIVYDDIAYWTTMNDNFVYYASVLDIHKPASIKLPSEHINPTAKFLSFITNEHMESPCVKNKGGCSHICVMSGNHSKCVCPEDYKLAEDGKNCYKETLHCKDNYILCNDSSKCILKEWKCDGHRDCVDGSDETGCEECGQDHFVCPEGHCISIEWICDGLDDCNNGIDEINCNTVKGCKQGQFDCGDGKCIANTFRCDNYTDCENNTDEQGCEETKCHKDHHIRCNNGQCISYLWRCDGENDCRDGSDEIDCENIECRGDQFRCGNGVCIDLKMVCDEHKDCSDGSDENTCIYEKEICSPNQFQCADGHCIDKSEICDIYQDCSDNDDELNCTRPDCPKPYVPCGVNSTVSCIHVDNLCDGINDCGDWYDEKKSQCDGLIETTTTKPCKDGSFPCVFGQCIKHELVCDGFINCFDGSDEGPQCETSCENGKGDCSQRCHILPSGQACYCYDGYKLGMDKKTCNDIDECASIGFCSQICTNYEGGFNCSCVEGYELTADLKKCKVISGVPLLVYMLPNKIRLLELRSRDEHEIIEIDGSGMKGIDIDVETRRIFWTNIDIGTINSIKFEVPTEKKTMTSLRYKKSEEPIILFNNVKKPSLISWDYIAKNIYFIDVDMNINVCNEKANMCGFVVRTRVTEVHSFVVSSRTRLMFWSVWSSERSTSDGTIERADMDGKDHKSIIKYNLYSPNGLTVDPVLDLIYWIDVKQQQLYVANLDGNDKRQILNYNLINPQSIAVFEDSIYWANVGTDTLMKCNKFRGNAKLKIHQGNIKAHAMKVFHEVMQPKEPNPCANANCKHLCLLGRVGFSCHCMYNFHLHKDNSSCILNQPTYDQAQVSSCNISCNFGKCVIQRGMQICICRANYGGAYCEILLKEDNHFHLSGLFFALIFILAIVVVISRKELGKSPIYQRVLKKTVSVGFKNPMIENDLKNRRCQVYSEYEHDHDSEMLENKGFSNPYILFK